MDENFGWRKTGLMSPPKGGSVMEFPNIQRPVGNVLVFYTSSYSEKWKGSRLSVEIHGKMSENMTRLANSVLDGYHDRRTSDYMVEVLELSDVVPLGGKLQIHMALIGGTTFKILGLALCR